MTVFRLALLPMLVMAFVLSATPYAQRGAASAPALLRQAIDKEVVDGDIAGAIKLYQTIVDRFATSDRPTAAQALLRVATGQERLGSAQAQATYQQVLDVFGDQRDVAAEASRQLARRKSPLVSYAATWRVPDGGDLYARVSRDGRYLAYTDWDQNGDLFLWDRVAATSRRLTTTGVNTPGPGGDQYAEEAAFSRDGRQVAYSWFANDRYQLRLLPTNSAGPVTPQTLVDNPDIKWIWPEDWTSDGRSVAVGIERMDKTAQIGLISTVDRSLKVLKSFPWRGFMNMGFSPRNQYLAFDVRGEASTDRDVFLLSVDGAQETPLTVHKADDEFVGWSPDGTRVIFWSDRTGADALWSQAVVEGRPQGQPILLKGDIGPFASLGLTNDGTLFTTTAGRRPVSEFKTAEFDFETAQFRSTPSDVLPSSREAVSSPMWSQDMKLLAYISRPVGRLVSQATLKVFDSTSKQIRDLRPALATLTGFRWADDDSAFLVVGTNFNGRQGVYRIERSTGLTAPYYLASPGEQVFLPRSSNDGSKIYYRRLINNLPAAFAQSVITERDVITGHEREVVRGNQLSFPTDGTKIYAYRRSSNVAPGGAVVEVDVVSGVERTIYQNSLLTGFFNVARFGGMLGERPSAVAQLTEPGNRGATWVLVSLTDGSTPRELMKSTSPDRLSLFSISPDYTVMLVRKDRPTDPAHSHELWRISLTDRTPPQPVDVSRWPVRLESIPVTSGLPGAFSGFRRGTELMFTVSETVARPPYEVWMLQGFLP